MSRRPHIAFARERRYHDRPQTFAATAFPAGNYREDNGPWNDTLHDSMPQHVSTYFHYH